MSRHSQRSGVTLIELLVVISIVSILVGLLLPAVQSAREAARRTQCSSNMRMIGLAMSNYESAYRVLPAAAVWRGRGIRLVGGSWYFPGTRDYSDNGNTWANDGFQAGFFIAILPYLEQSAVYDRWNFSLPVSAPANREVRGTAVSTYVCPSDPYSSFRGDFQGGNWARGNYGVNAGPNGRCLGSRIFMPGIGSFSMCDQMGLPRESGIEIAPFDPFRVNQVWGSGVAGINRFFRISEATDGTSNTVAVDELRAGIHSRDRRGVWALPMIGSSITFGSGRWNYGGIRPNVCRREADQIQDCNAVLLAVGQLSASQCMPCTDFGASYMATARSLHPGGVQTMNLDGSVRFTAHEIDLDVWTAIHTRAGGETVNVDP